MGTLANSLFQALMGWVRMLSAEIWNTVFSPDRTTLTAWIGQHWKALALGLCAAGLAIDLAVYLFRWQPYRVWRSRRKKKRGRGDDGEPAEEPGDSEASAPYAADLPAGTGEPEEYPVRGRDPIPVRTGAAGRPAAIPDQRYANWMADEPSVESGEGNPYSAFRRPVNREREYRGVPEEENVPYRRPVSGNEFQEERTTARFEQAIRPRRRNRVTALLSEKQDERSPAPDQLIDRNEAYRRPVYPRSWQSEDEDP